MKISCIDIGGTYIKSGVLEDGVLTGVEETPTDGGGGARAMLSRVAQLVRQTPGVERVGVSTAGEVDARTGVIRLSDNIPGYTGLNPRQILEGELGLPVAVENDVNAAAAGEFAFGAARDEQDFLMVSYGTGVGGAVYIGGRLYRGRAGSAGEFGGLVTHCALPGFVDSKNEEKTERNAGYLVVSHSGGGMLRQGTRKGIRRTPANRGMRAHRIVKSLDISEDVCHGLCP